MEPSAKIQIQRINREDVRPVQLGGAAGKDKRPIRGSDLFPEIYANIFFCARKKSGKTQAILHTIKKCATIETHVVAFVSTLNNDPTWRTIQEMCKEMKVQFTGHTSMKDPDTGADILDDIVRGLQNHPFTSEEKDENEQVLKAAAASGVKVGIVEDKQGKKPKRPKEKAPRIIFIFDDLSNEIKRPSLTALVKKNRQFQSKVIIASQYWNDLDLQARKQMDYVLIWPGQHSKLEEIHRNLELTVSLPLFNDLYSFCTMKPYHFMWIDVVNSEFRKDFTHKLGIPQQLAQDPVPDDRDS